MSCCLMTYRNCCHFTVFLLHFSSRRMPIANQKSKHFDMKWERGRGSICDDAAMMPIICAWVFSVDDRGGQNAKKLDDVILCERPLRSSQISCDGNHRSSNNFSILKRNFTELIKVECQPEFNMFKPWCRLPNHGSK